MGGYGGINLSGDDLLVYAALMAFIAFIAFTIWNWSGGKKSYVQPAESTASETADFQEENIHVKLAKKYKAVVDIDAEVEKRAKMSAASWDSDNYEEDMQEHSAARKEQYARRRASAEDISIIVERARLELAERKAISENKTGFYWTKEWRELRYTALKTYGGRCQCCGVSAADGAKLHVDHIKPRSKYPALELDLDNLQILCEDCNLGKSNKDHTDWRG